MRIVLVTTDAPHHRSYAARIAAVHPLAAIVVEERVNHLPFATHHPYEDERDAYEREVLLAGRTEAFDGVARTVRTPTANDAASVGILRELRADVVLSFGPGRLDREARAGSLAALNVHGGDPERYRGLDSHLWAIYHSDLGSLVTTLHHLADRLDTGDIARRAPIQLRRHQRLCELRAANTELAVTLTLDALAEIGSTGRVSRTAQRAVGRYYSAMPAVLKDLCVRRFEAHTARL